ncbi:MAG: radical SAM protein [Desulfurococcales archaeon]|nr:radical SAM protein [Desulfurococcales archaeon]
MIVLEFTKIRPDALTIWQNPEVRRRLSWYLSVLKERAPPRYKIAKAYVIEGLDPDEMSSLSLNEMLRIHRNIAPEFRDLLRRLKDDPSRTVDANSRTGGISFLEFKIWIARKLANPCILCERKCMIDREKRIGACRLDNKAYVHSAFLHLGEEAPLVPSGTIFYGGCNFTCVYCQNHDVSQEYPRNGEPVNPRELAAIQDELAVEGARNINHVGGEPTPSAHIILESMLHATHNKPQLWNSNMYMTEALMEVLLDVIDIWLPDFKYGNNNCAFRLSGITNYWETVTRNLKMASAVGDMIIRHLILPSHLECCTFKVLDYIARELPSNNILVNIMDQYRPMHLVYRYPSRWRDLSRRPLRREIIEARNKASQLGICWRPVS